MKFPKRIEEQNTMGSPLCEQAGETMIDYAKYSYSMRGDGFPVENFNLYDPTLYPKRGVPKYKNGYSANINILINQDGSIYPQISIMQGEKSYSVWDGKERKGTSGLRLLKLEELTEQQKTQIETVINIFGEALNKMIKENPNNKTFDDCMKFFGISKQQIANLEQGSEMEI